MPRVIQHAHCPHGAPVYYAAGVSSCPSVWSQLLAAAPSPYVNASFAPTTALLNISCR
jgi:hypothetical protein